MKIGSLWRYPVKSMLGEEIAEAIVTERGLVGDRGYALIECETGHVASAKHARKWAALLQCRARYLDAPRPDQPLPVVEITLPDGRVVRSDNPDVDAALSALAGRRVMLSCQPPQTPTREANRAEADVVWETETIRQETMGGGAPSGTFFDFAPIHLITSATLTRLSEIAPDSVFDARRFRPNIVVEALTPNPSPSGRGGLSTGFPGNFHRKLKESETSGQGEYDNAIRQQGAEDAWSGFVENGWLGRMLEIGGVRLYATDPTPRCVITTLAHGDIERDLGVLKTVVRHNSAASVTAAPGHVFQGVAGVYARCVTDGTVRVGDALSIV
jgi:uncharacterized protein YcbX